LAAHREKLIAGRDTCTLFDIDLLARKLEGLYAQMADEYRAGALPQPDITNLPEYLRIGASFDHDGIEIGLSADYHGRYRAELAKSTLRRPLAADTRLWTEAAIAPPAIGKTSRAA
jgi:hypothetical protein